MSNDSSTPQERAAARASDMEQKQPGAGAGGNMRDSNGPVESESAVVVPEEIVGSSGHVVRRETAEAHVGRESTGSPGAEADRQAAERAG